MKSPGEKTKGKKRKGIWRQNNDNKHQSDKEAMSMGLSAPVPKSFNFDAWRRSSAPYLDSFMCFRHCLRGLTGLAPGSHNISRCLKSWCIISAATSICTLALLPWYDNEARFDRGLS